MLLNHILLVAHNYLFERLRLHRAFRNRIFINARVIVSAWITMRHDVHFVFQDIFELFDGILLNPHGVFQIVAVLLG